MRGSLDSLKLRDFRCLENLELKPAADTNLIIGPNASGKTSLLEAIFVLGRGRSFRATQNSGLIRDGADRFEVVGTVAGQSRRILGVRAQKRDPLVVRIDGEPGTIAALSRVLPVETIDPEVHKLVEEGPERRRRYLDWGTFHVEQRFLSVWRDYRKALRHRNILLQQVQPKPAEIEPWDNELAASATSLTQMRQQFLAALSTPLKRISVQLLDYEVKIDFRPGWDQALTYREALARGRERDIALGRTLAGPHRAELIVQLGDARARARVSRGQQKLVASSLILAQLQVFESLGLQRAILLLDDPAAELDRDHVERLFAAVQQLDLQLFATALDPTLLPDTGGHVFEIEQLNRR